MSYLTFTSLAVTISSLASPTLFFAGVASVIPALYIANFYYNYKRYRAAMPWSAKEKVVVITGASSGIGEELAYEFARQGAILNLCARRADKLASVAKSCKELGATQVVYNRIDVTRDTDVDRLIESIDASHEKIDCLVLNAGVSMGEPLEEIESYNMIRNIMDVNFNGCAMFTYRALPLLKKADKSRIVVISSLNSIVPYAPFKTGYAASKCALKGFFETLQAELIDKNIFISTAYPGIVKTEINEARLGKNPRGLKFNNAMSAEECAKAIVDGTIKAQREIILTNAGRISKILDGIFPELLSKIVYHTTFQVLEKEKVKDQ